MTSQSPPKPVFLATHPRACSTLFERIFLTRSNDVVCVHEPFSYAYHFGPERLSQRYQDVEGLGIKNDHENYTYQMALDIIDEAKLQGKRVFIKDMAKFLIPLQGRRRVIAPSLRPTRKALSGFDIYDGIEPVDKNTSLGLGEEASAIPDNEHLNPTVIPLETLLGFHFTFLIRHPRRSIPSLYRLSIPPKSAQTGWCGFSSYDAGYRELRILFDFLKDTKQIGPNSAGIDQKLGQTETEICVVDCDELLEDPEEVLETYCKSVGIPFEPCMLRWDKAEDRQQAKAAFEKWGPFHDTILNSTSLMSQPPTLSSPEEYMAEWTRIFGQEGAKIIQEDVDVNLGHYMYLKSFAIKARVGDKNNEKREYAKKDIQT